MNLLEKQVDGFAVVSLDEKLDASAATAMDEKLMHFLKESKGLILDLKNLSYLSSGGMRLFIKLSKQAKSENKQMALCGLSKTIVETLEMTGFLPFLNVFPDVQMALTTLKDAVWSKFPL